MNRYLLLAMLSICCLALGGIFVKLSEFPPITTGMYRVLFSLPVFFILMKFESHHRIMSYKEKGIAMIAGVFLALDLVFWNISFAYTTVANANLLANLVPFTVVPISYFLYKEKLTKSFLLGAGIMLIGLMILMNGKISPTLLHFKGDLLALLTSVFYGLFMISVYKLRYHFSTIQIMAYASIGCLIVLLPLAIGYEGVFVPFTFAEIYPLIGLALLSQILGQGGLSYCLGKINASFAALLVLTQPMIAAFYAYVIFGERLSFLEIISLVIVLIGLYIANKK
ncbi:DMT family transporter [Muribacter muris]|uniref:DMT family transporter n=1 Tax=Muribacter muris TaxID=67855 RepID=A0A4Y9K5F6_9PAST|nr:DMT family transporter [Muribacter muris]MBF0783956.1 DMT family transporter [Muribacter muris]MBF0827495.1 DMT family transporter [Muribacter muris]TFV13351.1 DMT family transporter [Muribacter muris]